MSALKEELSTLQDYLCIKGSPQVCMRLYLGQINTSPNKNNGSWPYQPDQREGRY